MARGRKPLAPEIKAEHRRLSLAKYAEKNRERLAAEARPLLASRNRETIRTADTMRQAQKYIQEQGLEAFGKSQHPAWPRRLQVLPKKLPKANTKKSCPTSLSPEAEGSDGDEDGDDEGSVGALHPVFPRAALPLYCPEGCGDRGCEGSGTTPNLDKSIPLSVPCTPVYRLDPGLEDVANHLAAEDGSLLNGPQMGGVSPDAPLEQELQIQLICAPSPAMPSCETSPTLVPSSSSSLASSSPSPALPEGWALMKEVMIFFAERESQRIAIEIRALDVEQTAADTAHANTMAAHRQDVFFDLRESADPMTLREDLECAADLAVYGELEGRHRARQRQHLSDRQELLERLEGLAMRLPNSFAAIVFRSMSTTVLAMHTPCCVPRPIVNSDDEDDSDEPPPLLDVSECAIAAPHANLPVYALDEVKHLRAEHQEFFSSLGGNSGLTQGKAAAVNGAEASMI
ncbi:hypothetical protein B0H17DRAFT_1144488 [Mycena rosella]|uniref:Uncharacterized protein n=1 Tax=Mycena rosella TaxID=1033263 RepID=A0AAD7CT53_MYCRO|nr:hypothetical protein B0H17DRAFT_1144488 [Mycena rosella]